MLRNATHIECDDKIEQEVIFHERINGEMVLVFGTAYRVNKRTIHVLTTSNCVKDVKGWYDNAGYEFRKTMDKKKVFPLPPGWREDWEKYFRISPLHRNNDGGFDD